MAAKPEDKVCISRPLDLKGRALLQSLYAEHQSALKQYLRRYSLSEAVIEDLVQDVFVKLVNSRKLHLLDSEPRYYLLRMATNLAIDLFRHNRIVQTREHQEMLYTVDVKYEATPEEQASVRQMTENLKEALAELKPLCRRIFIMNRIQQIQVRDIASDLGVPLRTVERHLAQAIAYCAECLGKNRL